MEHLISALGKFSSTDQDLTILVQKCLARLQDDIEESGMTYSSVMEQLWEDLEEYMKENYILADDPEVEEDDEDEDDLRDVEELED